VYRAVPGPVGRWPSTRLARRGCVVPFRHSWAEPIAGVVVYNRDMKSFCRNAIITVFPIFFATTIWAQGVIIIEPPPSPRPPVVPALSVLDHRVRVSIDNQVGETTVKQVFTNNSRVDLEGTYIFPIPANASITEFSMWMNGRKVTGELLGAQQARKIYQDIVRRLKDPGLLEYMGRDMFRARVYPIPAHGEVQIEVVYHELLRLDAGVIGYRYPLGYQRSGPGHWGNFSIDARIKSDVPIKSLYSPNYDVERRVDGREAYCSFEERDFTPGSDFLVYYTVSEEDIGMSLMTHRRRGREGHFMLLLSPGSLDRRERALAKDVVFVIDRSGSMRGEKIEQAREALSYCIGGLNEDDRFRIVTFAGDVRAYQPDLTRATKRHVRGALDFVDQIRARGGTDINGALLTALDVPASRRPQFVIFLTDGEPTVGETDIYTIIDNVGDRNKNGVRLFVFGVGYDVNTRLLDRLSADNRGTVEYVRPEENIETKVSNFYAKVSEPVLSDPTVNFANADVYDVFPPDLPDLFAGSQLIVVGRYHGSGPVTIRLSGFVEDDEKEFVYEATFAKRNRIHEFLGPIWASRKIAYLIEEIRSHGENKELVDEVIELSTSYGIVTPYTSYLILEDDRPGRLSGAVRERHLSWAEDASEAKKGFRSQVGADAVTLSRRLSDDKREEVVKRPSDQNILYMAGKTFYKTAQGWIDADYKDGMATIDVTFLSKEYFQLIDAHPELAQYLSIGKELILVYDGSAYKVKV